MALSPELIAWLEAHTDCDSTLLGEGYQAEVRRIATPYGDLVIKSPRRGSLLGRLAGKAIRREHAIYRRLAGIPGIPRAHGLLGGDQLVLDFIDGPDLRAVAGEIRDREGFFARLRETIEAMHAAGVAHGDLKRKDNIVVGPGERPYIIDFGIARLRGRSVMGRYLFGLVRQLDLNAWIKLKHGRRPAVLPAADAAIYRPLLLERIARWVRVPWQKLTLRRLRRRGGRPRRGRIGQPTRKDQR